MVRMNIDIMLHRHFIAEESTTAIAIAKRSAPACGGGEAMEKTIY